MKMHALEYLGNQIDPTFVIAFGMGLAFMGLVVLISIWNK